MARTLKPSPRFRDAWSRLVARRPELRTPLARAVVALGNAAELPGPADNESLIPPSAVRYWTRRVPNQNLWLWYRFTDGEVLLTTLTTESPVPLD